MRSFDRDVVATDSESKSSVRSNLEVIDLPKVGAVRQENYAKFKPAPIALDDSQMMLICT